MMVLIALERKIFETHVREGESTLYRFLYLDLNLP